MDALAQCIESYVSKNASPMTDGWAIQGVRLAAQWLRRAFENGKDVNAREGMAHAALISGITLTNAGLGAVHGLAAPLGANFPVPHGAVCAALLPEVIGANLAAARDRRLDGVVKKYADVGRALAGEPMMRDESAIATCEAFAAELVRDLKIPGLKEYGVREQDVDEMVTLAKRASSMKYNPVELTDEVLRKLLRSAIEL
jgi:alcohol dehydrogenase class IV